MVDFSDFDKAVAERRREAEEARKPKVRGEIDTATGKFRCPAYGEALVKLLAYFQKQAQAFFTLSEVRDMFTYTGVMPKDIKLEAANLPIMDSLEILGVVIEKERNPRKYKVPKVLPVIKDGLIEFKASMTVPDLTLGKMNTVAKFQAAVEVAKRELGEKPTE